MQKKVLFCATIDGHLMGFHIPYLKWFKERGWEVHVAANGNLDIPFVDRKYNIPIQRSPFNPKNRKAYRDLKSIINENKYNIIHCHTPMGGVLTRLAARKSRKISGTKVIYTAHGFHFYKGAPLKNWLIYFPIEKGLSNFTDCLITINNEDFNLAIIKNFKASEIRHVHGVGVDTNKFAPLKMQQKKKLRLAYGYTPYQFLMFYAAEFNKNKNQQLLLKSLALIKDQAPYARLLLAGDGPLLNNCRELAKSLGIEGMVEFLGYRKDLELVIPICDIAVASSIREGLPVNIMEAMACGLPIIASENRGHSELVKDNENGFIFGIGDFQELSAKILEMYNSIGRRNQMGDIGFNKVKKYSLSNVCLELIDIYEMYMVEDLNAAKNKHNRAYI